MASRGQYMLKIAGRLDGAFKEPDVKEALGTIFSEPGKGEGVPDKLQTGGWPLGFVLMGYTACQWDLKVDNPHPDQTMITFRAEIHHTFPNSLYQNKDEMLRHVKWFYHYRDYRWWQELSAKLDQEANPALLSRFKQTPCLRERLWFRDWQWYCGNGGC